MEKIKYYLSKKYSIGNGVEVDGSTLLVRVILLFITASWVSFYPSYLMIIHMAAEDFFSYDIFSDARFSLGYFTFYIFTITVILSFCLWGALFYLTLKDELTTKQKRNTQYWLLVSTMALAGAFVLGTLGLHFHEKGLSSRFMWLVILSLGVALTLCFFIKNTKKKIIGNKYIPVLAIIVSAVIPAYNQDAASDFVKTSLMNFKMGGEVEASVIRIRDNEEIKSGKLLLLSPKYIVLREQDSTGYAAIERSAGVYVSVK